MACVDGGVASSGSPTPFGSQCSCPWPVAPCAGWRTTPDGKPSPSNVGAASDHDPSKPAPSDDVSGTVSAKGDSPVGSNEATGASSLPSRSGKGPSSPTGSRVCHETAMDLAFRS